MPPGTESELTQGYGPPTVRQFSVFLDNRVGKLLDLVQLFEDAPEVSLRAFSVLDSSDHAVVRLIFDNADAARHLMRRKQFTFSETDLLVVELAVACREASMTKFTLKHVCMFLLAAELNIRFAYPVLHAREGNPMIALAVDDNTLAGQILRRKGFRLLGEEDLV
ncbi:MAG: acetolactate synthase [Phycisphaerae bacterium]|nr:acetolactate synthase [Phycisphaerae bacterium]